MTRFLPIPNLLLIAPILGVASCATSTLYRDGQPIARFQGDMRGVDYQDGNTRLRVDAVDHSSATRAGGEAAKGRIEAAAVAIAAGATLLTQ